jgi:site-specific recombinase XerD
MIYGPFEIAEEFFLNFTSENTRNSYRRDLKQFLEFVQQHFPEINSFDDIGVDHILTYRNSLMQAGGQKGDSASNKTIARKLAALSSLFKHMVGRNQVKTNPLLSIKRPRPDARRPTQALSAENVEKILDLAYQNKSSGPLHYFLLVAFFTTGLRKSELLFRKFGDIKKHSDFYVLEYEGKGSKRGQKRLHPLFLEAYEAYRDWMIEREREVGDMDWLFQPSKNPSDPKNVNKPLNPKTINEILSSYAKKLGLGRVTPHSARATFITRLLEQGIDLYDVSQEVQHTSVTTTQIYDKRRRNLEDSPVTKLKYSA